MTDVLRSSSHFPSSPSSSLSCAPTRNDGARQSHHSLINHHPCSSSPAVEDREEQKQRVTEGDNLSLLALWVTSVRKHLIACRTEREELCPMEIGSPTNVRHVAHVTFDRFNGFLGLPLEFEPEVPRRAPSASANVFGVKTESMQCSYDSRGNSVPTILLLMQSRLYAQGGLQAEGIFRINAENSQEEYVRDQLNRGVVPDGIDVHCLAGLIKAWFRELPTGVLDPLAPEKVMQCKSEEECAQLVKLLPPMEASLLDWAINLMADVVEKEHQSKMNARNIAMVFAPNMTQMADPLIALMYAVQVMNFLKTLIERILREREDSILKSAPTSQLEPSDENGHHSPSLPCLEEVTHEKEESGNVFISDRPLSESPSHTTEDDSTTESGSHSCQSSVKNCSCEVPNQADILANGPETSINVLKHGKVRANTNKNRTAQLSDSNHRKGTRKVDRQPVVWVPGPLNKSRGSTIISRINSRTERVGVWR